MESLNYRARKQADKTKKSSNLSINQRRLFLFFVFITAICHLANKRDLFRNVPALLELRQSVVGQKQETSNEARELLQSTYLLPFVAEKNTMGLAGADCCSL